MSNDEELLKKLNSSKKKSTLKYILKLLFAIIITILGLDTQNIILFVLSVFISLIIVFASRSKLPGKYDEDHVSVEVETIRNTQASLTGGRNGI